jgi:hypothetical protein
MSISKVDICNLALSRLAISSTVENIDNPQKKEERVFKKWYDVSRATAIKLMKPSFAKKRDIWAKAVHEPAFGFINAYKYKNECLRILGIGNLYEKTNNYSIEGSFLLTNADYSEGLPVRYLVDINDPDKYPPDFIQLFSWQLAYDVCPEMSNSREKFSDISNLLPLKIAQYCGTDAQESPPIRIVRSGLRQARRGFGTLGSKP